VLLFVAIMETTPLVVIIPPSRAVAALGFTITTRVAPLRLTLKKLLPMKAAKALTCFFYVKRD
jgi:hypothetical protein